MEHVAFHQHILLCVCVCWQSHVGHGWHFLNRYDLDGTRWWMDAWGGADGKECAMAMKVLDVPSDYIQPNKYTTTRSVHWCPALSETYSGDCTHTGRNSGKPPANSKARKKWIKKSLYKIVEWVESACSCLNTCACVSRRQCVCEISHGITWLGSLNLTTMDDPPPFSAAMQ